MSAALAYATSTAARQGWDEVDRELLSVLDPFPATLTGLMDGTGYSEPIVKSAILGCLQGGYVVRVVDHGYRYELTLAGRTWLAQFAAQDIVPAMRQAA